MFNRKFALALVALGTAASAFSQPVSYPTKMVRITSPFAPGAGPEVALRVLTDKLSKLWGQSVIIDNKAGGNGMVAAQAVKRAPADGYELLQVDTFQVTAQPHLLQNAPVDYARDFEPVTPFYRNYFALAVAADSRFKTLGDMLSAAKAAPDSVTYGSTKQASPGHLGALALESASKVRMTHVIYKQQTQLMVEVANRQTDWVIAGIGGLASFQQAGRLRYLAMTSPKRLEGLPDVPTVAEAGGPQGFELAGWVGLLAPKGVPQAVVEKLQRDIATVLADPDTKAQFAKMYYEPWHLNSQQFAKALASEREYYRDMLSKLPPDALK